MQGLKYNRVQDWKQHIHGAEAGVDNNFLDKTGGAGEIVPSVASVF